MFSRCVDVVLCRVQNPQHCAASQSIHTLALPSTAGPSAVWMSSTRQRTTSPGEALHCSALAETDNIPQIAGWVSNIHRTELELLLVR